MPHAGRPLRRLLPPLALVVALVSPDRAGAAGPPSLAAPGRQPGELERVQMHRNGLRSVHYLPAWRAGRQNQPKRFTLRPVRQIDLDGDPQLNVRGNVYPLDGDGDGTFELLHFNGYRLMRAYDAAGRKLWQVDNPSGRVHRDFAHRDTLAVFDADGDGGQDIVHCWSDPDVPDKLLVLRDGETGEVLKQVRVAGQTSSEECQLAAFRVEGQAKPLVLVAGRAPASACARGYFTPYFAETHAYTPGLARLWERMTCAAGHYAWPLDEDGDGQAEAVFVGKYLLRPDGTTRCVLPIGGDHVDSMVVADLDPAAAGLEALTVGASGVRFFAAGGCALRWQIPTKTVADPQQTSAVYLRDTAGGAPDLLVTTPLPASAADRTQRAYTLDTRGGVLRSYAPAFTAPVQNANLDGAPQAEDRLATFGQVVDRRGRVRLGTGWYWGLQGLTAAERRLDPRDQWTRTPFAFDLDDDGRDELVVWGRRKLVVGSLAVDAGREEKEGLTPARARAVEANLERRLAAARGGEIQEETRARLLLLAFRARHAALLARPEAEAPPPPPPGP